MQTTRTIGLQYNDVLSLSFLFVKVLTGQKMRKSIMKENQKHDFLFLTCNLTWN